MTRVGWGGGVSGINGEKDGKKIAVPTSPTGKAAGGLWVKGDAGLGVGVEGEGRHGTG